MRQEKYFFRLLRQCQNTFILNNLVNISYYRRFYYEKTV